MRRSAAVWFASYGLSLLGKGIAAAVLPLLVLDRTGDVLAAGVSDPKRSCRCWPLPGSAGSWAAPSTVRSR